MKPQRIQLSRRKGFNLQAASIALNGLPAVNCARPSVWGNPWKVGVSYVVYSGPDGERSEKFSAKECVARYRAWLPRQSSLELDDLRGKNLACWCKLGTPCHAHVLLELANKRIGGEA